MLPGVFPTTEPPVLLGVPKTPPRPLLAPPRMGVPTTCPLALPPPPTPTRGPLLADDPGAPGCAFPAAPPAREPMTPGTLFGELPAAGVLGSLLPTPRLDGGLPLLDDPTAPGKLLPTTLFAGPGPWLFPKFPGTKAPPWPPLETGTGPGSWPAAGIPPTLFPSGKDPA